MKYLTIQPVHPLIGMRYKKIAKIIDVQHDKILLSFPRTYQFRNTGEYYSLYYTNWQNSNFTLFLDWKNSND